MNNDEWYRFWSYVHLRCQGNIWIRGRVCKTKDGRPLCLLYLVMLVLDALTFAKHLLFCANVVGKWAGNCLQAGGHWISWWIYWDGCARLGSSTFAPCLRSTSSAATVRGGCCHLAMERNWHQHRSSLSTHFHHFPSISSCFLDKSHLYLICEVCNTSINIHEFAPMAPQLLTGCSSSNRSTRERGRLIIVGTERPPNERMGKKGANDNQPMSINN